MSMIIKKGMPTLAAMVLAGAIGCSNTADDFSQTEGAIGEALAGTDAADFSEARGAFATSENAADGLGPIFNERGCGTCHQNGAVGGAGQQVEARYGTLTNGVFNGLPATGGSLRQLFGLGGFNVGGLNCQSGSDANPAAGATIFAGRLTTPTFGLGLVEALPDSTFDGIAAAQPATIRGIVNRTQIHITDAGMTRGQTRVARFGWKAVHASLTDFAGDAYLNEMGITTTSCTNGTVITDFATENRANGRPSNNPATNGCPDDAVPGVDDDLAEETNNCAGRLTEVQDDVAEFAFFMRNLAPPARGTDTSAGRGLTEFNREGCNGCHVT